MKRTVTLGSYLKQGRLKAGLSTLEVARLLGLSSPTKILAWERDEGSALPLLTLKKLISLYGLDVQTVFDLLLQYQFSRLEQKFKKVLEAL